MTVRLTPTESDISPQSQVPVPPDPADVQVTAAPPDAPVPVGATGAPVPDAPDGPVRDDGGDGRAAETRRAIREARRQRRRTAWLCAAVVAACLALTIVVVSLARERPVAPPASLAATAGSSARPDLVPVPTLDRAVRPTVPSRGAPASEGGNP
jgi:hypothetical protein